MIYIYNETTGKIRLQANAPINEVEFLLEEGEACIEGENVDNNTHYVEEGELVAFPEKPNAYVEWDWENKEWFVSEQTLNTRKRVLKDNVDELRGAKNEEPILYEEVLFDADLKSIENIKGVVARIERGDGLTTGWIGWRAFDNSMHWSEQTAEEVLVHLHNISRALEDRKQALMVNTWQHKSNIDALETIEEIIAYDVTVDWIDNGNR